MEKKGKFEEDFICLILPVSPSLYIGAKINHYVNE